MGEVRGERWDGQEGMAHGREQCGAGGRNGRGDKSARRLEAVNLDVSDNHVDFQWDYASPKHTIEG